MLGSKMIDFLVEIDHLLFKIVLPFPVLLERFFVSKNLYHFKVLQRKPESGSTSRSSNCSRAQRDEIWSTFSPQVVLALPKQPRPVPVSNVKTPSISESEKEVSNVKAPSISESEMEVSNMKTPSISESEKELPLKKRMYYRPKVEKKK